MSVFSETIDYSKKTSLHSAYRWIKLTPVGGTGQTVTLSASSPTIVNFEIPNNVCNLSLSKLAYDLAFVAQAAGSNNIDALGLSVFDRITLSTRSGVILANADNMGQFCHIISKIKTKLLNLVDNPSTQTSLPTPLAGSLTPVLSGFPQPPTVNTTKEFSSKKPYTDICKSNACPPASFTRGLSLCTHGTATGLQVFSNLPSSMFRMDGSLISSPFLENLHILTENKILATATTLAVSYQIPLSSVKDTLLEVNRSLYFGDNLILSLSFNPTSKFSWISTSGVDVASGALLVPSPSVVTLPVNVLTVGTVGTAPVQWSPIAAATAQTLTGALTNLALYVAIETDPVITSQLISQVNGEGFSMTIPYVYCTKSPISGLGPGSTTAVGTGSYTMQQRITRGYGKRLLRCYSAIFGNEGATVHNSVTTGFLPNTIADGTNAIGLTAYTAFTTNLHDDAILGGYNTTLDGVRLQDFTLSASDSTHYLVNEPYLRGSCILNIEQYKNQCMHIDSWTGLPVCEEDDTIDNGLSLDVDRTYGVSYTSLFNISSVTTRQHYLFFVVQRQLMIKSNQIGLM